MDKAAGKESEAAGSARAAAGSSLAFITFTNVNGGGPIALRPEQIFAIASSPSANEGTVLFYGRNRNSNSGDFFEVSEDFATCLMRLTAAGGL
jgi:hypothetical protein